LKIFSYDALDSFPGKSIGFGYQFNFRKTVFGFPSGYTFLSGHSFPGGYTFPSGHNFSSGHSGPNDIMDMMTIIGIMAIMT
jgi:hypothetical protein